MNVGDTVAATAGADRGYVGRFAPTPSGPLHLGSLLTAVASWLDARARQGRWLLRIDDVDTPRVDPRAEAAILRTLEAHGLFWDGDIVRQSDHVEHYQAALEVLRERCYACRCTRRELRGATRYPGICAQRALPWEGHAVRIRAPAAAVAFTDRVQGAYRQRLADTVGDFTVRRRDGVASYQLAVVVDDAEAGINHVVRGADLLDNTPRQLFLMSCLGLTAPSHAHVPVVVEATGVKLSKHNLATAIDDRAASGNLATVLNLLGLDPPQEDAPAVLEWAVAAWDIDRIPKARRLTGFVALA